MTEHPLKETAKGRPERYLWASIVVALLTMLLKLTGALMTDSVGLLSDAFESFVNLAGAGFGLWMLRLSREPPDREHPYGHGKAEYFASAFEGILISLAALAILWSAVTRLMAPKALQDLDLGIALSALATVLNFIMVKALSHGAKKHRSIALEADSQHLMTDVWTSMGVIFGIFIVKWTGLDWLDPLIAILVALHIMKAGGELLMLSAHGLLDSAIPASELALAKDILEDMKGECEVGDLRSRRAGHMNFLTATLWVPGHWQVERASALVRDMEKALKKALAHLEARLYIQVPERHAQDMHEEAKD